MTCPHRHIAAAALAAGLSCMATADYYDAVVHQYFVSATDFGGVQVQVYVQDVYLLYEGPISASLLSHVRDWTNGPSSARTYFHSFLGNGWLPSTLRGPFQSEALSYADSFVSLGTNSARADTPSQLSSGLLRLEPEF